MSEEEEMGMSDWRVSSHTRKKGSEINHGVRERSCVKHFTRIDLVRPKDEGRRSRHLLHQIQIRNWNINRSKLQSRDNGKSCNSLPLSDNEHRKRSPPRLLLPVSDSEQWTRSPSRLLVASASQLRLHRHFESLLHLSLFLLHGLQAHIYFLGLAH